MYYTRDFDRLAEVGKGLIELSPRSEDAGRFYYSVARIGLGLGEFDIRTFEELAESESLSVRAASLLALGGQALRAEENDEAARLFRLSYDLCRLSGEAPLTSLHARCAMSLLLSKNGYHKKSLELLQQIQPAAYQWGSVFRILLGEQFNNVAYELSMLGELQAAQYAINKACAMPVAAYYPEWFETKKEIEAGIQEKQSQPRIFTPGTFNCNEAVPEKQEPEERKEINLVPFTRRKFAVWLRKRLRAQLLKEFTIEDCISTDGFHQHLSAFINELDSSASPPLTLLVHYLENNDLRLEEEKTIARVNFNKLFLRFDELDMMLEILSEPITNTDIQDISAQTKTIIQMIEADEAAQDVSVFVRMKTRRHTQILEQLHATGQDAAQKLTNRLSTILESLNDGDTNKIEINIVVESNGVTKCGPIVRISRSKIDELYEMFEGMKTA